MYADTVIGDKLIRKPGFLSGLLAIAFPAFFIFNMADTIISEFLRPIIGEPRESGLFGRSAVALVLGILFVGNLFVISLFPIKVQIGIVWRQLLLLFLAFFYSFDLKFSFIQSKIGYVIDAVPAGIIALSLCYGAYMTEIFRADIQSIPRGQWEASRSQGFKFDLTMRRIILPQAVPLIIPPTGNQFIAMLKDSSLVSVIGVWELMFLARTLGQKDSATWKC